MYELLRGGNKRRHAKKYNIKRDRNVHISFVGIFLKEHVQVFRCIWMLITLI